MQSESHESSHSSTLTVLSNTRPLSGLARATLSFLSTSLYALS